MSTTLDVVIPVLNEEQALAASVRTLHSYLSENLDAYEWRILVADNGSTDSTPEVCRVLSEELGEVTYLRLEQRGRGRALKKAWMESAADIVCYMDVDLSTGLDALPELVAAFESREYDLAIGSRLAKGAEVRGRTLKREFISRAYNLLLRAMFFTAFRDAQCGFKAASRRAVTDLAPLVVDNGWFFDTELLILAEKNGYAVKEVPVTWTDDPDTKVKVLGTAWEDFKGLLRLRFGGLKRASRSLGEGSG
jgi:glycosyltransferase involved in cell wall biosynthesis